MRGKRPATELQAQSVTPNLPRVRLWTCQAVLTTILHLGTGSLRSTSAHHESCATHSSCARKAERYCPLANEETKAQEWGEPSKARGADRLESVSSFSALPTSPPSWPPGPGSEHQLSVQSAPRKGRAPHLGNLQRRLRSVAGLCLTHAGLRSPADPRLDLVWTLVLGGGAGASLKVSHQEALGAH